MKDQIKKMIPSCCLYAARRIRQSRLIKKSQLLLLFLDDFNRYKVSAFGLRKHQTYGNLISAMTFHAHSIEKGLSHQDIRLGFGKRAFQGLFTAIKSYVGKGYDVDDERFQSALSVIDAYIKLHDEASFDVKAVKNQYKEYQSLLKSFYGGTMTLKKEDILACTQKGFPDLVLSRFSTRDYSNEPVDLNLINQAIETSMKTPSICNRQPWEVIVIQNKTMIEKVLQLQGGLSDQENRLSTLLVVLSKSEYLFGPEERNQGYVDGGMFAMTLLYALHQQGLAACPLNADFDRKTDRDLRKLLNIKDHDCFIMMLSVGNYQDRYKVPRSHRDDYSEITSYIQ